MTKILKAKYKVSRRLGTSIWGDSKDPIHSRNYRPGQHGASMTKRSDYGVHLKAKQMLKAHYGRINEKQFKNLFKLSQKMKGNTAENFIGLLESRLDIVVYRLNLAPTIFAARQLVVHGHISLNGKKVNIPSQRLQQGDEISTVAKERLTLIQESVSKMERTVPSYLSMEAEKYTGKFLTKPQISDVPYPFQPELGLIIELYSR